MTLVQSFSQTMNVTYHNHAACKREAMTFKFEVSKLRGFVNFSVCLDNYFRTSCTSGGSDEK